MTQDTIYKLLNNIVHLLLNYNIANNFLDIYTETF